jgi:hypothetical protein
MPRRTVIMGTIPLPITDIARKESRTSAAIWMMMITSPARDWNIEVNK